MSLQRIPGQPISFYEQDECVSTGSDFFQLVKAGDEIQFQFKIGDDCGGADIVADGDFGAECGDFWDLNEGWTCFSTSVCYNDGSSGTMSQSVIPIAGTYVYKFSFEVTLLTFSGFSVTLGVNNIGNITAPGEYVFYLTLTGDGSTPITLTFTPLDDDARFCIASVSLIPISAENYFVNIFTSDGDFVGGFNYLDNPDKFNFYKNFLTVSKVIDFPDGCYYFCVNELCNCVSSGSLTLDICDYNWVEGTPSGDAEWTVEGSSPDCFLGFGPGGEGNTDTISAEGIICTNFSYIIGIVVSILDARVKVIIGSYESGWITASGSYNIDNSYNPYDSNVITFLGESTSNGGSISIDEISVTFNGLGENPSGGEYCSQPIQVYSDESQFCTKLLEGCNNSDAFGFGFNDNVYGSSGFTPSSRVAAKLFPGNYNQSFSIEENSIGERSVKYAQSRKAKRLRIIDTAEYLWDWIALWIGLDTMKIDGSDYVIEEDGLGDLNFNKFQTLGTGDIQVGEKTQNMYKTNCSDAEYCKQ